MTLLVWVLALVSFGWPALGNQFVAKRENAFLVALKHDEEIQIGRNGQLSLSIHCLVDVLPESAASDEGYEDEPVGFVNIVRFIVRGPESEWHATAEDPGDGGEVRVLYTSILESPAFEVGPMGLSAASASGTDIIALDVLNVGASVFGYGCFASGTVYILNAP